MPIHPSLTTFLADPRNLILPPPANIPMEKVRRAANGAMHQGTPPEMVAIVDGVVESSGHPVPIRTYRPNALPELPVIFFVHGGGFVWGNIDTHDGICRHLAKRTAAAVISIDYRLAPETRYPGAIDDVGAVVDRVLARPEEYGIDPDRFALCGDSAGGSIATALCARLTAAGLTPRHLALIYPALDPACDSPSQMALADGPLLTRAAMQWFWDCYLGPDPRPDAGPPSADMLKTFPPTTILTAEFDPLRDEGTDFAARLGACGVDVELRVCSGMVHGFLSLAVAAEASDAALDLIATRLCFS